MAWDGISLLRYLLEKSCGRHHIASNVIKNKRGRTIQIFSGERLKTLLPSSPVLQGQKRGQFAFRWKTGHDQVDNFLTWTNLKRQLGNALWVYSHLITTIAPPSPLSKETIVSEQNIWILRSLLIWFGNEFNRGYKSSRVKSNFNRLVKGCFLNIRDELNATWSSSSCEWKYLGDICTKTDKKVFWSLSESRVWLAYVRNFNFIRQLIYVFRLWVSHFLTNIWRNITMSAHIDQKTIF